MTWKIEPAAVSDVLKKVDASAKDLANDIKDDKFEDLGSALTGGAGGLLQEVPAAVMGLIKDQGKNFKDIQNHIAAGLAGVTSATIAYANAQVAMSDEMNRYNQAETFEKSMLTAAKTGDQSYFQTHYYDEKGNLVVKPTPAKPEPGTAKPE